MIGRRAILMVVFLAVAACDFAVTPVAPSPATHGDFEWDINPPPTVDRPFIVGCADVVVAECDAIVGAILAAVPAERRSPSVVEIELWCTAPTGGPAPETCPPTLGARDRGRATIEFADRLEPLEFSVSSSVAGPIVEPEDPGDCRAIAAVPPPCWELRTPTSPKVTGTGPFDFQVGHCGLNHVNDFDGSFWVVAGFVNGFDVLNSGFIAQGRLHLIDADTIFYREQPTRGGDALFARLERLPDQKYIWRFCA